MAVAVLGVAMALCCISKCRPRHGMLGIIRFTVLCVWCCFGQLTQLNNVNVFMSLVMYVWAFVGLLLGPPLVMATCVSMQ